jgi:chaperonin GroEL (HSP60 family)
LEVQIKSIDARTPAGIKVVSKALEAPIRQIAENSGVEGFEDFDLPRCFNCGAVIDLSGKFLRDEAKDQ